MNNLAREKLFNIVATYGRTVCNTPRACEIFLNQQCEDLPAERDLLIQALRLGTVPRMLEAERGQPWEAIAAPLTKELAAGADVSPEDARWAVDSWALALGKHPSTAPPPPPVPVFEAPPEKASGAVAGSPLLSPFVVGLGGAIGSVVATVLFTVLIYTMVSTPNVMRGTAGALALVMGIVMALAGGVGGAVGGAVGWLLIQAQAVTTPHAAELARWRLLRGFMATCGGAASFTVMGGWFFGLVGIGLGALVGGFSGAVVSGLKG